MPILLKAPRQVGSRIQTTEQLVILDATISDSFTGEVKWTEDPIEDGATIQDHAIIMPDKFTVTGVLSRTPFAAAQDATSNTRVEDAIARLRAMQKRRLPVTISNGLWVFQSMGLSTVNITRDSPEDGNAPKVSLNFQEITITTSTTVQIPPDKVAPAKQDTSTPQGDAGSQSATASDGAAAKATVKASIAAQGFDFLTGK